jgi:GxxExxY protein
MLRVPTRLSDEVEATVAVVIGACVAVHRELGPGLLEAAYRRAIAVEFECLGVSHDVERVVPIVFRGVTVCHHRLDLVVEDQVILELKAVERLAPVHLAQALSYLRVTRMPVALLINFNVPVLKAGIRRVVL